MLLSKKVMPKSARRPIQFWMRGPHLTMGTWTEFQRGHWKNDNQEKSKVILKCIKNFYLLLLLLLILFRLRPSLFVLPHKIHSVNVIICETLAHSQKCRVGWVFILDDKNISFFCCCWNYFYKIFVWSLQFCSMHFLLPSILVVVGMNENQMEQ